MNAKESKIMDAINTTVNQNDPTQKVIMLLAVLVEEKFHQINETINTMNDKIDESKKDIDALRNSCPLHLDLKIKKLEEVTQPISFINNYPKLGIIMIIGFITLCGMGIERIISLLS